MIELYDRVSSSAGEKWTSTPHDRNSLPRTLILRCPGPDSLAATPQQAQRQNWNVKLNKLNPTYLLCTFESESWKDIIKYRVGGGLLGAAIRSSGSMGWTLMGIDFCN